MIEIRQVRDPFLAKKICEDNGLKYQNDYHVIATIDNEKTVNHAVYSYAKGEGAILSISGFNDEIDLLEGLCRAVLNIMDLNGVINVFLPDKYRNLAEKIGFSSCENGYSLDLDGFFCSRCCCEKEI